MSPILVLLANVSARTRALIGGTALVALGARLLVFGTALAIARAEARLGASLGAAAACAWFVFRGVSSAARAEAEHDLYGATGRALVDGDVFDVADVDFQRVTWEGNHHGRGVLSSALPGIVADGVSVVLIVPIVAGVLPARLLVAAGAGGAVMVAMLFALRGINARLQAELLSASQSLNDALLVAIEGRLELVARGGEDAYARSLDATLSHYRSRARRAALGSALLGRLPLVGGLAMIALSAVADAALRDALASAAVAQAVVLAASAVPVLGAVTSVNDLVRLSAHTRALVDLLGRPARRERSAASPGAVQPELPVEVLVDNLSFSYGPRRPAVFESVSFRWPPDRALVLRGSNGAGKSTLLRLLLGLRSPSGGRIVFGEHAVETLDLVALRRRAAFLPQRPYLGEPYASVRQAVQLTIPDAEDAAIERALERLGLDVTLDARIGELSAGQRQRIALARAWLVNADLVLLDEPDANLDREGIALIASLVVDLVRSGKMVAVAAHTRELAPPEAIAVEL